MKEYTNHGYRVLALASKSLPCIPSAVSKITRAEAESNLTFVGLIVFENKLKNGTVDALRVLKDAEIRSVMCTGMFE